MKRILSLAGVLLAVSLMAMPVRAQVFRAYVASYGADTNPCTIGSPCRLLPAALGAVQDGGEIWLLDSANFNAGAVTISKSVSILAIPGQVGSIVAVGGANAINVDPGLTVALKNVSITSNANSPGIDGIDMTTGRLSLQDSLISVPYDGIRANGAASVSVHNTVIRDSLVGVFVSTGGSADVSASKFINLTYGVYAEGNLASVTTYVNVRDCEFAQANTAAVAEGGAAGGTARLAMHASSITGGTYGVVAVNSASGANAIATVGSSKISGVGTAFLQSGYPGAVLQSMGNNFVVNNTNNSSGTITPVGGL
jgi:hypothetical protein